MRYRNPGRRRHCAQRRHARDDFELEPSLGEGERLLAAAAEDERIAALQPDDVAALAAERDEQLVDL
jgi:hypothetical protein